MIAHFIFDALLLSWLAIATFSTVKLVQKVDRVEDRLAKARRSLELVRDGALFPEATAEHGLKLSQETDE